MMMIMVDDNHDDDDESKTNTDGLYWYHKTMPRSSKTNTDMPLFAIVSSASDEKPIRKARCSRNSFPRKWITVLHSSSYSWALFSSQFELTIVLNVVLVFSQIADCRGAEFTSEKPRYVLKCLCSCFTLSSKTHLLLMPVPFLKILSYQNIKAGLHNLNYAAMWLWGTWRHRPLYHISKKWEHGPAFFSDQK